MLRDRSHPYVPELVLRSSWKKLFGNQNGLVCKDIVVGRSQWLQQCYGTSDQKILEYETL